MSVTRTDFTSRETRCAADLYLPEGVDKPPVIVMAHGFGAERSARLPAFAERFMASGYAVLLFDYRSFGDSDGEPRQLVSPRRHLQDWRAAIALARSLPAVDNARLVLWGTSFSGGHVVRLASEDSGVRAIIAQVPFTSGLGLAGQYSFPDSLRMTLAGLRDLVASALSANPVCYPVVAPAGELAIMNTPECYHGYLQLFEPDSRWENRVPARIALQMPIYNPAWRAGSVRCPALVVAGRDDSLIPARSVRAMAERMALGEYRELPVGHFEPYVGEVFEQNIALQLDFLSRHLS